jgi:hypothetical protein
VMAVGRGKECSFPSCSTRRARTLVFVYTNRSGRTAIS